jgi:hypothetical protein
LPKSQTSWISRLEKAEKILREREEWRQLMDELDRAHERLRQSALEFR